MRAVCNTETFGKKLALVSRGVSARSTIQLLGGILLEAGDGVVRLSATDMEISIQTSSPAEVEEEGRVVIPARIFNDIVRPERTSTASGHLRPTTSRSCLGSTPRPRSECPGTFSSRPSRRCRGPTRGTRRGLS